MALLAGLLRALVVGGDRSPSPELMWHGRKVPPWAMFLEAAPVIRGSVRVPHGDGLGVGGCRPCAPSSARGSTTSSCTSAATRPGRLFGRIKRFRHVVTRYDKIDLMFGAFSTIVLIADVLR